MKRISGFVLVRESNSGVPNLVVSAYDSDSAAQRIEDFPPRFESFSLKTFGKRIGSVLTDPDGGFELTGDDLNFQGNESRPDLSIIIFAPEDVQDPDAPYPLRPEDRILYVSRLPRDNAGAEEAFVIRLLQAQLDRFHLTAKPTSNETSTYHQRVATAIESTWDYEEKLKLRLQARLRQEQEKSDVLLNEAAKKVEQLSATPSYLTKNGMTNTALLVNGRRELAESLHVKQRQTITQGLERMQSRNARVHLSLTLTEVEALGLTVINGAISGDIDPKKLTTKVRETIGGLDLVRKRGLDNPTPEELIKKYLIPDNRPQARDSKTQTRAHRNSPKKPAI